MVGGTFATVEDGAFVKDSSSCFWPWKWGCCCCCGGGGGGGLFEEIVVDNGRYEEDTSGDGESDAEE